MKKLLKFIGEVIVMTIMVGGFMFLLLNTYLNQPETAQEKAGREKAYKLEVQAQKNSIEREKQEAYEKYMEERGL